jgi:hypothetical protein
MNNVTLMKTVDYSDKTAEEVAETLKKFGSCDITIKDEKSLVVLDHTGYGLLELVIDK